MTEEHGDIQVIRVEPGDTVVVMLQHRLTLTGMNLVREAVRAAIPHLNSDVVVLDGGATIGVLKSPLTQSDESLG